MQLLSGSFADWDHALCKWAYMVDTGTSLPGRTAMTHPTPFLLLSHCRYPYQVLVLPGEYMCGGSLIADRVVVTAAQ